MIYKCSIIIYLVENNHYLIRKYSKYIYCHDYLFYSIMKPIFVHIY